MCWRFSCPYSFLWFLWRTVMRNQQEPGKTPYVLQEQLRQRSMERFFPEYPLLWKELLQVL